MANRFYAPWVADGKPFRACTPVAEVIAKFKAARPAAAKAGCFGSIGNLAHLTADIPKDHTPYSQTGWPLPSPYGVGFAVDIMHRPDLGVDCNAIFAHWLAEAKAGRLPWLKYLIWQGKSYSVRNNWEPRDADGHFDHIHASTRTDHVGTHIGDFDPLGEDMAFKDDADFRAMMYRLDAVFGNKPKAEYTLPNGTKRSEANGLYVAQAGQDAAIAELAKLSGMDEAELESVKASAREGALAGAEAALTPEALADAIPPELAADVVRLLGEREAAADRARADVLDG